MCMMFVVSFLMVNLNSVGVLVKDVRVERLCFVANLSLVSILFDKTLRLCVSKNFTLFHSCLTYHTIVFCTLVTIGFVARCECKLLKPSFWTQRKLSIGCLRHVQIGRLASPHMFDSMRSNLATCTFLHRYKFHLGVWIYEGIVSHKTCVWECFTT